MRLYVNVYVGQTRAAGWIRRMEEYGFGEMCVRNEVPPRRHPWAFDNGAFKDWTSGVAFDEVAYQRALDTIHLTVNTRPDFLVVPDIVAGGGQSLAFSLSWVDRLVKIAPLYLAVQDGMTESEVSAEAIHFDGIFVGGTVDWKVETGERWVQFAHNRGLKCHIGRCGSQNRVRWAQRIGADSIDSCLPLWSEENLQRFLRALGPSNQLELGEVVSE